MKWELNKKNLTEEFIAGLVTANGVFSAVLVRRTKNKQHYHRIDLKFTIQLAADTLNLILEIKNKLDNKGNFIFIKKNKTIKYQITNQKDLLNVVIPFFMKHHLRGEKLLSFLQFNYILEMVSSKVHLKDKNIFLSLIVIAGLLNPMAKLGNKIRYLYPEQQYFVINNIQPEGVDISKLTGSIANFKPNPLTLDFLNGLLESNNDNFFKLSKQDQDYVRENLLPTGLEHWQFKEYSRGLYQKSTNGLLYNPTKQKLGPGKKYYSSKAGRMPPVKLYKNAAIDKKSIISENKGISGVYMWINLKNGKCYIGSSINIGKRLKAYMTLSYVFHSLTKARSLILSSILKYGYASFSVKILEYCDPSEVFAREQYYLDLVKPEYNILKTARPFSLSHYMLKRKMLAAKGGLRKRMVSAETRARLRKWGKSAENLARLNKFIRSEQQLERLNKFREMRKVKIQILDTLNNKTIVCDSIEEAARLFGKDSSVIRLVMKNIREKGISRLINDRYYIVLDGFEEVIRYTAPATSLRIEVMDTLTNKKTVCETQKEAAALIGCVNSCVVNALRRISPDSPDKESKLIKKRYTVKLLTKEISNTITKEISYTSWADSARIEVMDTYTNIKTVFNTKTEAAAFIGCVNRTVVRALSGISPDSPDKVSKLIKKRYTVKLLKEKD